ncbi:hypothetical protein NA56DRAFT_481970 [Hyaloscypha hepaticicola]|uniref:Secreted protein n=1 Tax=Hyaloscypha hepaticicola TaxID=2082293 RepID=A0A2J6PF29_9HELO|nr:hypothetical protein NA56DRAFT_481970 [Hyaloscypha hepaticicola]
MWCSLGVVMLVLSSRLVSSPILPHRAIVETVWGASVGVGFKVRLDCVAVDCAFVSDLWSWMGGGCIVGWLQASSRRGRFSRGQEQRSQVRASRGRIVLGGGMYVAKGVLKLGIRSSTLIRVEGVRC